LKPPPASHAWLNGRIVPAAEALLPVDDRAVLYGDSLFETVPIRRGRPFRWVDHLNRLDSGARITGIDAGLTHTDWTRALRELLSANGARHGAVRMTVTRGSGPRGYSPRGAGPARCFLTWHPTEPAVVPHPGWHLRTSPYRILAGDPLAGAKHGSRLLQVLARADAEAHGADEALLLNSDGFVAETSSGNLFWIRGEALHLPAPGSGALTGVTAAAVIERATASGWTVVPATVTPDSIATADGAFLTLSTLGIVPILSLDGTALPQPPPIHELAHALDAEMESA